jgi:hypothetical protein
MDCPGGFWNTSLRIGFACPSTTGESSSGSEKVNDRAKIIGLCPCKWLFLKEKKNGENKKNVIKTKERKRIWLTHKGFLPESAFWITISKTSRWSRTILKGP